MQAAGRAPLTGPGSPGSHGSPRRPSPIRVLVGVAATVLMLDVVSKLVVVATLSGRPPVRLAGGFLHLLVSRNAGAAFSIGTSMTVVFSAIAIGVIVIILRTSHRIASIPWALTLGLLLGGATGNLADRVFRYPGLFRGHVVDWIELPHWPVFNLADSAIVCGGILAILLSASGTPLDGAIADGATRDGATTDAISTDETATDEARAGAPGGAS
ncbi:MAG: signal peptidase II [Streptosporangiaceae bacterium]